MNRPDVNLWRSSEHALEYLGKADSIPHRTEGEGVLLECLPPRFMRKRTLFEEVHRRLNPAGVFLNLEHVASATEKLHEEFLAALSLRPEEEDPSNKLLDVETQLGWLRAIGFDDVDCLWKWRELALLAATKPSSA